MSTFWLNSGGNLVDFNKRASTLDAIVGGVCSRQHPEQESEAGLNTRAGGGGSEEAIKSRVNTDSEAKRQQLGGSEIARLAAWESHRVSLRGVIFGVVLRISSVRQLPSYQAKEESLDDVEDFRPPQAARTRPSTVGRPRTGTKG